MDFWEVMPYSLIDWCQGSGGTCCLWNSDTCLPNYTASQRRLWSLTFVTVRTSTLIQDKYHIKLLVLKNSWNNMNNALFSTFLSLRFSVPCASVLTGKMETPSGSTDFCKHTTVVCIVAFTSAIVPGVQCTSDSLAQQLHV